MKKHKCEDYKIITVKYYLKHKNLRKTCKIFECAKSSLQRWVKIYKKKNSIKRKKTKRKKYKINDEIIKFILDVVKKTNRYYTYQIINYDRR